MLLIPFSLLFANSNEARCHSVQQSSVTMSCLTLCNPMDYIKPGFPVHHQLLELSQTHVHLVSDVIQSAHPLCSPSLPAFHLSHIRVFSNELVPHIRRPKYWSFSFSISLSNEYSRLISFRTACFDLLAVHRTLKGLLQHHSLKSINSSPLSFFMVQLSCPYMNTGKTIALTRPTFVSKDLLFNMLSRLVITFLPRSKPLLISWLQSPSAIILKPPKIKSLTVSFFPHQ